MNPISNYTGPAMWLMDTRNRGHLELRYSVFSKPASAQFH